MSEYGRYEGDPRSPQEYERAQVQMPMPPQQAHYQQQTYDDNFIEALTQRIVQRMGPAQSYSGGKIRGVSSESIMKQRLALAIVSVSLLVPLSAVTFATLGLWGLFPFAAICIVLIVINSVFAVFGPKQ